MTQPKILCIDGYNFMHRARSGFTLGPAPVVFNFFRNLRALVEAMQPTRVYFTLEGRPKHRYEMLPDYKANRAIDPGDEKAVQENEAFLRQKATIVKQLCDRFPVSVVRHPDYEADDVVYNLIKRSSSAVPWVVASNDSDFIQLLDEFPFVALYNPMTKEYVKGPDYEYVVWKALRGDGSDNIPGLVKDDEATRLVTLGDVADFVSKNREAFERNYNLIRFKEWTDEEAMQMTCSTPQRDWDGLRAMFEEYGFKSLLKEATWSKFIATFDPLFG